MPRWDPSAEDRLREAALALFLEHGYHNVTLTDIPQLAALPAALAAALRSRGASEAAAQLLAEVGLAVFRTAFARWTEEPDGADFPVYVHQAAAELTDALEPIGRRTATTNRP